MENGNIVEVAQITMKKSGGGGNLTNCDLSQIGEYTKEFFKYYKDVYSFFDDEISKNIFIKFFECRLLNRFDGMIDYSSEIVRENYIKLMERKEKNLLFSLNFNLENEEIHVYDLPKINSKKIAIYGAGAIGRILINGLKNISEELVVVDCYYESIVSIDGINVISEEDAFEKFADANWFIASGGNSSLFYNKLLLHNISDGNIILNDVIFDNENQYFDFFKPKENEIFVDCGVYDATNSIQFTKWDKNFEKIYLFEPDKENYNKSKDNLSKLNISKFEIFELGLWNKETTLYFNNNNSSSTINLDAKDGEKIKVDSLDNVLNGRKVTFIKMDIEGVELKALQGAEQTIRNYKPRLAICVYHKVEDILEIPLYLKNILPEYKFALRHYTSKLQETVLYAWVE